MVREETKLKLEKLRDSGIDVGGEEVIVEKAKKLNLFESWGMQNDFFGTSGMTSSADVKDAANLL